MIKEVEKRISEYPLIAEIQVLINEEDKTKSIKVTFNNNINSDIYKLVNHGTI